MNVPRLRFKDNDGKSFPEWEEKRLEQLALVERGKFSVRPRNDPRYFGGAIPFVQTGDIVFAGLYLTRFSQTLNEEGLKVSRLFPKNTILITIAANIGDTTITKFDVACTDSVVAIQPYDIKANPVWLKLSLDTKKDELDSQATQNAQKNINLQILKPLLLKTPSFPEQTKIANFLTAVDQKITQLTQKCDLLAQYKKGVMQQIFSQQLRFKDDDGQDFPKWKGAILGELIYEKSTKYNPESQPENLKCIELEHLSQETGVLLGYVDAANQKSIKNRFNKGDVLFGKLRPYLKKFLKAPFDGVCSTEIWVLKGKKLANDYLYQLVQTENFLALTNISSGSKMPRADWGIVSSAVIQYPALPEQTKIANFLTAIDDKITNSQVQLAAVKQYKQGLLQQMFV